MMVPNIKSKRGVVHTAGAIRLLRCGTGTIVYDVRPGQTRFYEYTREPVTCRVCLKMNETHPEPEVPLIGCRVCGELPPKHVHDTNHPYELPTDFQVLVRSSLRRGGGYLVEIPDHECNGATLITGTDEVDHARVAGNDRVTITISVRYQDHTCSVCGALQRRIVLGQKTSE